MKAPNSATSPMRISGVGTPYCLVASSPSASISASAAALSVAAEALDADLQEFGRRAFAMTEHGAEIAIARGLAGLRRLQIIARHRDRQIGPQAQFAAVRIAGEEHAPADVLAAEIEKRLGRLQHRRRNPLIGIVGAARIGRDQRFGARVGSRFRIWRRRIRHGLGIIVTRCAAL